MVQAITTGCNTLTLPTATDSLYLVIDQGGHATRALIFDQQGSVLHKETRDVAVQNLQHDRVEQDPDELVQSLFAVVEQIGSRLGERAQHIKAAALATQRSSIACWQRDSGKALSAIISWQDRRARSQTESLSPYGNDIHRLTGLRLSPHYGASKLHWCLTNLRAVQQAWQEQQLAWGPVASFFLFHLLAEHPHLVDPVNASRTLLWNRHTGQWDASLLQWFEVPGGPLPHCVANRYHYGHIKCGPCSIPMMLVTGDQSAALFADGIPQNNTLYVNVGTGAFVQHIQDREQDCDDTLLNSMVYNDGSRSFYAREGTVNGCGSAMSWAQQQLGIEPDRQQLADWLQTVEQPPLFMNGISGLGSPYWQAHFDSEFIGQADDAGCMVAVVESIVFLLAINVSRISSADSSIDRIRISGGLSRLDGLCQRLADVTALVVSRTEETEATARGAAFLLMNMPDDWPAAVTSRAFTPAENPALLNRKSLSSLATTITGSPRPSVGSGCGYRHAPLWVAGCF